MNIRLIIFLIDYLSRMLNAAHTAEKLRPRSWFIGVEPLYQLKSRVLCAPPARNRCLGVSTYAPTGRPSESIEEQEIGVESMSVPPTRSP